MAHFGARALVGTPDGLYVGSANHAQGTAVWRDQQQPCQSPGAIPDQDAVTAPAPPRRLLGDVQRDGTVVSWATAAHADRYRVLRARQTAVSLSVVAPPAFPSGLRSDEQLPVPAPPGTPGSRAIAGTTLGRFETIGTTRSRHFIDRSRDDAGEYAYQVIAEGRGGDSRPSGVHFVPDARPRVTWPGLRRAAGPESVSRRLGTAAAALAHGELRRSLATLAQLRRTAPRGSEFDELAWRLARQIRYRDAAGGPA
jgi:hypothetical protein